MSAAAEPQDADLPRALVKRLIKAKLQEMDRARGGDGARDFQINKDCLLALGEAGKLFIHYLALHANDLCKEARRQTISAEDVLAALAELEFDEFIEPLKAALEGFKAETREKNKKKSEASKKRKSDVGGGAAAAAEGAEAMEDGAEAAAEAAEGGDAEEPMEAGE